MSDSESSYVKGASRLVRLSEKCLKDYRYFVSLVLVTSAVIVSTVVFSQKACAEVGGCESSMGCINCLQAKEICEDAKQQLVELAYLSTVTAG